jgi:two-component system sensor histidine kinase FlrB
MADQGRQIQFTVSDNGEGIDPEASQHIFEPFFTTRAKGTGLGLSIVKQISDLHGGHIELTANQPVGTRAVLSLPLIPAVSTRQQGQVNLGEKQRA